VTDEEIEAMFTPGPPCAQLLGWRLLGHDEARGWIKVGFVATAQFLNPAGRVRVGFSRRCSMTRWGRLMDEEGRLLARATSSVMLVPADRVARS
jgi:hypothetical protein